MDDQLRQLRRATISNPDDAEALHRYISALERVVGVVKAIDDPATQIIITRRYSDYHVCPKGETGCWAAGKTIDDAIGNLVRCHPERFNVKIVWPTPLDSLQRSL